MLREARGCMAGTDPRHGPGSRCSPALSVEMQPLILSLWITVPGGDAGGGRGPTGATVRAEGGGSRGLGARGKAASRGYRDQRPTASLAARVNSPRRERWGFC